MSIDTLRSPMTLTGDEAILARQSASRIRRIEGQIMTAALLVVERDGEEQLIPIPASIFHMLGSILENLGEGRAVTLTLIDREISTQKAADLLNVSRPYLIGLLEAGKIPFRKVGTHRRMRLIDVLDYKTRIRADAERAYSELVAEAQELGFYD